jgi:hypothetical protein
MLVYQRVYCNRKLVDKISTSYIFLVITIWNTWDGHFHISGKLKSHKSATTYVLLVCLCFIYFSCIFLSVNDKKHPWSKPANKPSSMFYHVGIYTASQVAHVPTIPHLKMVLLMISVSYFFHKATSHLPWSSLLEYSTIPFSSIMHINSPLILVWSYPYFQNILENVVWLSQF